MPGRFGPLKRAVGWLGLLVILVTAEEARAHHLIAEYRILGDRKVKVEGWFDLTGDAARGARVEVFRPDGNLLAEGRMDEEGIFIFTCDQAETLKVIVSAGAGHRKELEIPATDLGKRLATSEPDAVPGADRSSRVSVKDVLVGVGFVLAVAAFVLSLRTARQLREWQRRFQSREIPRPVTPPAETPPPTIPPTAPSPG